MNNRSNSSLAVMKFSALGDIAATLPFMRAAGKNTCVITSPIGKAFLQDEFSDFIILKDKSLWSLFKLIAEIRKRNFSDLIDLQGNDRCRFISACSGSITHHWFDQDTASNSSSELAQTISAKATSHQLYSKRKPNYIVLNPGSSAKWSAKRPPAYKWKEFVALLNERFNLPIKLVGSAEEFDFIEGIAKQLSGDIENLAGKTSLSELKNLLGDAFLTISTDSAAMHIAAVQGTPTIGIFGSTTHKNKLGLPWTISLYDHTYYPDGNLPVCTAKTDNYYDHIDLEEGLSVLKEYIS